MEFGRINYVIWQKMGLVKAKVYVYFKTAFNAGIVT